MRRGGDSFQTIKTEGSIIPSDFLRRLLDGDSDIPGFKPEDYHLAKSERLNEVATRAWNRLQGAWEGFSDAIEKLPESDVGTSLTRERWLLILFQELGYGRLTTRRATEVSGKSYPISHEWQNTPIHLVSFRQDLDRRTPGRAGAARVSPHSLLQEFLNRSEDHLWGFVSNGLSLRLLRDNASLTRQAYVEFDLQAMMDSEAYSDFFLLFLLCHQSRVEIPEGKGPSHCWLEKWYNTASQQGVRALDQLRNGVQNAIESLGGGFLAYPGNHELRDKLKSGQLSTQEYYRQVLRQVYRLLFLFVAEDRDLLLDPNSPEDALKLYTDHYSTRRIRKLAGRTRGTRHPDLWRGLNLVLGQLHDGCPSLGIPAFGSFLFSEKATETLCGQDIANSDLLKAIRALAYTIDRNVLQPVNYRSLGPEELGSVYEALLEMHPDIQIEASNPADRFRLTVAAGSERKTTGSYYTPTSLVNCLLDSALDPVIDEAIRKPDPEKALLALKVCDPACGSGHFLIAAAHRIAKRLASIRAGEEEPSPIHYQHALRDVIGSCIYGVDINPMSVELCKVSLWLEAIEPGRPLSFLDHRIKCGNSLLGATPALLAKGIPDEAFKPIEGDDKSYCTEYRKQNKKERESRQAELFAKDAMPWERLGNLPTAIMQLDSITDATLKGIEEKEKRYAEYVESAGYRNCQLWADAWCAAFVWVKRPERDNGFAYPITEEVYRRIEHNPYSIPPWMVEEIQRLANQYQFFHWHIEFPDVFRLPQRGESIDSPDLGWSGGFDCILGNPPWEKFQLEEKHFFATQAPEIAAVGKRERGTLISSLQDSNPTLYNEYTLQLRLNLSSVHMVKTSSLFDLAGRGNINSYSLFVELSLNRCSAGGTIGLIVPSGLGTQDTLKELFGYLIESRRLHSFFDFENSSPLFPGVHRSYRFALVVVGSANSRQEPDFAFGLTSVYDLEDSQRLFKLSLEDLKLLSPNTQTCPAFQSRMDSLLAKYVYRNSEIIKDVRTSTSAWGWDAWQMFNETHESNLLIDPTASHAPTQFMRVYESKLIHQYTHRYATYCQVGDNWETKETSIDELRNPEFATVTRYLAPDDIWNQRVVKRGGARSWAIGFRLIARATDSRTFISSIVPRCVTTSGLPIVVISEPARSSLFLLAVLNSFVFDYVARTRTTGTSLNHFIVHQLPILTPMDIDRAQLDIRSHVLELAYSSWDLGGFAKDCGYSGPPFKWNVSRRFELMAEIDATIFNLYFGSGEQWRQSLSSELIDVFPSPRHAVTYVMDSFPIVKRKDMATYGNYRTKHTILDIYDEMAEAIRTGKPYQTRLDPPPGPPLNPDGSFAKLPDWPAGAPKPKDWPSHIHEPRRD